MIEEWMVIGDLLYGKVDGGPFVRIIALPPGLAATCRQGTVLPQGTLGKPLGLLY
ncbi:hypothetical protein X534_gp22 [Ralstonia phage RSB3]|uniref:Uncharacterized protein n=1 Tax=Ralstonia phage RSB3 TaxID=1402875 RepID=U3TK76_9CAUD|nr:hypothetical protein X534_gp22 [Ralstonia phage RSB3]BAN92333.1 hypothetical protein [Ralstonia phage RSB3]